MSESCVPSRVSKRVLKNYILSVIRILLFSQSKVVLLLELWATEDIVSLCYKQKILVGFVVDGLLQIRMIQFCHFPILILNMVKLNFTELL